MSDTLRAVEAQALSEPFTAPDIHYRPGDRELLLVTLQASLAINRLVVSGLNYDRPYDRKADDSPATVTDRACEEVARQMYEDAFGQSVAFMGEEGGGEFVDEGICVAVDPIDGTWAYIGDTGCHGSSFGIYKDGELYGGLVSQPATSELMYAIGDEPTRLLRGERWGIEATWRTMPQMPDQDSILVNLQGKPRNAQIMAALYKAWEDELIKQVRSSGGSPAVGLAEVAKGSVAYVGHWRDATAYDLGAGVKIIENAGGCVEDADGEPIKPVGHSGLFIAGLHTTHRRIIREIIGETT